MSQRTFARAYARYSAMGLTENGPMRPVQKDLVQRIPNLDAPYFDSREKIKLEGTR